jgi:hypothetical protein
MAGEKEKVRRGKNVVRHLIETKFVGKQNIAWLVGADTSRHSRAQPVVMSGIV